MTTALDVIESSLKLIGVLDSTETLNSEDAIDSLAVLNDLLSDWNTQNCVVLAKSFDEFSLIASQNSYTLGSGGDFDMTKPVRTDAVFLRDSNGNEYEVDMIDTEYWGRLTLKNIQSNYPTKCCIDNNHPLKKVYFYPTPSAAATVIFHNFRKFSTALELTTEIDLPDGGNRALKYNLGVELAPRYGVTPLPKVEQVALDSLANLKRVNNVPRQVGVDGALLKGGADIWRLWS